MIRLRTKLSALAAGAVLAACSGGSEIGTIISPPSSPPPPPPANSAPVFTSSSAFEVLNAALAPDAGSLTLITSFGLDADGDLHIVDFGGDVFRVETAS